MKKYKMSSCSKYKLTKAELTTSGCPGGLARTHKIIRTQQLFQKQFVIDDL